MHYVASKGGILALTRSLAVELGPYNICINAVAPGFTDTEASRSLADVKKYGNLPIPLSIRNAPTKLMKDLGYGKGYKMYPKKGESLLPKKLQGKKYLDK